MRQDFPCRTTEPSPSNSPANHARFLADQSLGPASTLALGWSSRVPLRLALAQQVEQSPLAIAGLPQSHGLFALTLLLVRVGMAKMYRSSGIEPAFETLGPLERLASAALVVAPFVLLEDDVLLGHDVPPLARRESGLLMDYHVDTSVGHSFSFQAPKGPATFGAPDGTRTHIGRIESPESYSI